jgi:hypothetical protein
LGVPFASGPHVGNWPIYEGLAGARAVTFVSDAAALGAFWRSPQTDQAERARAFAHGQQGRLDMTLDRLLALLP